MFIEYLIKKIYENTCNYGTYCIRNVKPNIVYTQHNYVKQKYVKQKYDMKAITNRHRITSRHQIFQTRKHKRFNY